MYNFGSAPPRSLSSFGVSGLLGADCTVFFSSLFSTQQIGRVSDLISARLRSTGMDDLKFRALLLFSIFEADRVKSREGLAANSKNFGEPLVLECGIDAEKLAIGAAFTVPADFAVEILGLNQRIAARKATGEFERLLCEMKTHSDRIVIRFQPSTRRLEIVALLGFPGKISAEQLKDPEVIEYCEIKAGVNSDESSSGKYIELGDLDYGSLLKEDAPGSKLAPPATGKILASDQSLDEPLFHVKAKDKSQEAEEAQKTIKAQAEKNDETIRKFSKGKNQAEEEEQKKVIANRNTEVAIQKAVEAKVRVYKDQMSELQKKLIQLQEEKESNFGRLKSQAGAPQGVDAETLSEIIKKNIKKIWPFKSAQPDSLESPETRVDQKTPAPQSAPVPSSDPSSDNTLIAAIAERVSTQNQTTANSGAEVAPSAVTAPTKNSVPQPSVLPVNEGTAAAKLEKEIAAGDLSKVIERAQDEIKEIKKEVQSPRANRWMDSLMNELLMQKSKLNESAKEMHLEARQREHEFKFREQSLKEELRKSQEAIRQKESALIRAKEQLAHSTMVAERAKTEAQANTDDVHFKHKFNLTQKMLSVAKAENTQLIAKIEDLKAQLMSAQVNSTQGRPGADNELAAVKQRLERSNRQADEFKRVNQQLMEKLNEKMRKDRTSGSGMVDDLKKRLDAAMKTSLGQQKEADSLKLRLEESHQERARLQRELEEARKKAGLPPTSVRPGSRGNPGGNPDSSGNAA